MAYQMVQFHYRRAAKLDRGSKAPLIGLLYLDCAAGLPKNSAIQSSLLERFSSARFTFGDRAVVQSLSALLVEQKLCLNDQEVKQLIDAGLSNSTADGSMRGMINAVAMDYASVKMRSLPLALQYAQAAVTADPGNAALRVNLIQLYIQSNKVGDARREYIALANRQLSVRDKPDMNKLKTLFDAMDKNAEPH
jgi:thioredoxin-like negative regulator of GroEL